jgi:NAD(P)-dependent dehydrogenase (short-subunit alcohol dehydrogenase family)
VGDIFGLEGKVAIVWGGGLGMGERSVIRLAEQGCDVAVVDIDPARAERVAGLVRDLGRRAVPLVADARDEAQVAATVEAAEAALGSLDVSVTVIGLAKWKRLLDQSVEEWQADQDMNLKTFMLVGCAAARAMQRSGHTGAIVGVSSMSGLTAAPNHASYGAAKAGIANLVRSMAGEWGPAIRVNAVAPGSTRTPRYPASARSDAMMKERLPLQRAGETDEVAKAVLFLASDMSSYITGQTLPIEGGWSSIFLFATPAP